MLGFGARHVRPLRQGLRGRTSQDESQHLSPMPPPTPPQGGAAVTVGEAVHLPVQPSTTSPGSKLGACATHVRPSARGKSGIMPYVEPPAAVESADAQREIMPGTNPAPPTLSIGGGGLTTGHAGDAAERRWRRHARARRFDSGLVGVMEGPLLCWRQASRIISMGTTINLIRWGPGNL